MTQSIIILHYIVDNSFYDRHGNESICMILIRRMTIMIN